MEQKKRMKHISEVIPDLQKLREPERQSLEVLKAQTPALREDRDGKKHLAVLIAQCFDTLRLYGKEPEQLESVNSIFQIVLADYPLEKISNAFAAYLKRNNEFPAPADIVQIIERDGKPPFDKAVYVAVQRKPPEDRTPEEWSYIREYEDFKIRG